MNSDHAPTAEEQLPEPTPEQLSDAWRWIQCAVEPERPDYASRRDEVVAMIATAFLAQRQLLAALRENREKDARIAELEKERDDARSGNVAWGSAVGGLEAHLMDRIAMDDPASPRLYLEILQADVRDVRRDTDAIRKATWARERMYCASAEAAEAKLESVRVMVAYYTEDDNSLLSRIRAIVDSVPGSPQPPR